MTPDDSRRQETEALIQAIWGPAAADPPQRDPMVRERQNQELAAALKAYLQQYLTEM